MAAPPLSLAGDLPPWPEDPSGDAGLDDAAAALEERLVDLAAAAGPELREAVAAVLAAQAAREAALTRQARDRVDVLARVHGELARLRQMPTAEAIIAAAPRSACAACGFDRAVVYRVDGRRLVAEAFHVEGDPDAAARLLAFSREHPADLAQPALESEVVRRRKPMAVRRLVADPSVFAELAAAYDTRSYVAAPIMPEGRVIGFVHADHRLKPRAVDELDRDALWAFAEGLGHVVERSRLVGRLRAQGQELRRLLRRTEAVVAEYLEAEVELVAADADPGGASRSAAALVPEAGVEAAWAAVLSKREHEVLALVGRGASNADIAARLVITEETAKSHVKRILRKLGAGNRVEAATIWLRAQPR